MVAVAATALVVSTWGTAWSQQPKAPPTPAAGSATSTDELASGVIVKVEPVEKSGSTAASVKKEPLAPRTYRLTINTAAVWRDWARDQATENDNQSPKQAAARGAKSVATQGEPRTKETLVVVEVAPETKIETRFRTLSDETTKGARSPAGAREHVTGTKSKRDSENAKHASAKPVHFAASDLLPGLFVEANFHRRSGAERATTVTVIRPVSEPTVTEQPRGK